jgi:hypothetical protein
VVQKKIPHKLNWELLEIMSLLKSKCDDHVPSLDDLEPKDIFEFALK